MIIERNKKEIEKFYLETASYISSVSADTLLFIPVFNNLTYLRNTLRQLSSWTNIRVVILDNGSTYGPLLEYFDYLENSYHQSAIFKLNENLGPHYIFFEPEFYKLLPRIFFYSDPDLEFGEFVDSSIAEKFLEISNRYSCGKVGFALRIDDDEGFRKGNFTNASTSMSIKSWEKQFWKKKIRSETGLSLYVAPIDTTFALYNKKFFTPSDFFSAIRVAGSYSARHLPWYIESIVPEVELEFYKKVARFSVYAASN